MQSWPTYNCLNKIICSHGRNSTRKKKTPKKKLISSRKLKLIPRSHDVASLSLSLAFECIYDNHFKTNKLREGQLVFNFVYSPSLFLSFKFTLFPILNFCFSDTNGLHYFLATEYHLGKCPILMIA